MPSEIIIIVIELMFLGVNMFLALLRTHFSMSLSRPKTYLRPRASTLLLYCSVHIVDRELIKFQSGSDGYVQDLEEQTN